MDDQNAQQPLINQAVSDIKAGMPIDQFSKYYPELGSMQGVFSQYANDVKAGMPDNVASQYYPELFGSQAQDNSNNQQPNGLPQNPSVGGFLGNVVKSGANLGANIGNAVLHPIKTVQALGNTVVGGLKEAAGQPTDQQTQDWDTMTNFFKQRYGSVNDLVNTAYQDPVGFATDLATVLGAGAGVAGKVGDVAGISGLSDAADTLNNASEAVNPLSMAGKAVGGVINSATEGKTIAPFAGSFNEDVANTAAENGVDLPTSSLTSSKAVQSLEAMGSRGLFGGDLTAKIETAGQQINDVADNLVDKAGGTTDLKTVGDMMSQGAQDFKDTWIQTKNQLYDEAKIPQPENTAPMPPAIQQLSDYADKNNINPSSIPELQAYLAQQPTTPILTVAPTNTLDFLDKILAEKNNLSETLKPGSGLDYFQGLKDDLSDPNYNITKAQADLKELNAKLKSSYSSPATATGDTAALRAVASNLSDDIDSAIKAQRPEMAPLIDKANEYYKDGLNKLNSAFGKAIKANADQPEKIFDAVMRNAVPSDVPQLKELIGDKAFQSVQATYIQKMIESSKSSMDGMITPGKFSANLAKNDDMLKAVLEPEQYKSLQDINKLVKAFKTGQGIASGSQTAFVGKLFGEVGLLFADPTAAVKLIVGDKLLSKFLSSDIGQQFLTKGYELPSDLAGTAKGLVLKRLPLLKLVPSGKVLATLGRNEKVISSNAPNP